MNIQPYGVPRKHWSPQLTYWWFHLARFARRRKLHQQRIHPVEVEGLDYLRDALKTGKGVLLAPNHSFHWDTYCMLEAAERLATPFYFMTAWQVFEMNNWFNRMSMRRCGCFSVDREGVDMQSMKTAVDILQQRPQPLVIFPEGDVYHTNDRITPFRDGAAAISLMAARKADREVVVIPVAIKCWYAEDPTPAMMNTLDQLEQRLYWRPRGSMTVVRRIYHIASGLLSLKEIEHLGSPQEGAVHDRILRLSDAILDRIEKSYEIHSSGGTVPERVKEVRRKIIQQQAAETQTADPAKDQQRASDMHDAFLVTQLYSYPGTYLADHPSWERTAETLDKLEEDALSGCFPTVRGERHAMVKLSAPIALPREKDKRLNAATLTDQMESAVQSAIDDMNARIPSRGFCD